MEDGLIKKVLNTKDFEDTENPVCANVDLFYPPDIADSIEPLLVDNVQNALYDEIVVQGYKALIDAYGKKAILRRMGLLYLLDDIMEDPWSYITETQRYTVQSWLDKHDGKHKALVVHAMLSGGETLTAQSSIVVSNQGLWLPGEGLVDSYLIDDITHRLLHP